MLQKKDGKIAQKFQSFPTWLTRINSSEVIFVSEIVLKLSQVIRTDRIKTNFLLSSNFIFPLWNNFRRIPRCSKIIAIWSNRIFFQPIFNENRKFQLQKIIDFLRFFFWIQGKFFKLDDFQSWLIMRIIFEEFELLELLFTKQSDAVEKWLSSTDLQAAQVNGPWIAKKGGLQLVWVQTQTSS